MKELFVLAAKMMPEDFLLKGLQEALIEYRGNPTPETKNRLSMFTTMISIRLADGSATDMLDELKKAKQTKDLLNPSKF